jgi:DNA-binding transcriptional LysR family regulator
MVSVRIGPDVRFAVVGTKSYLAKHPAPETPQDLVAHSCINLRLATHGGLWAWEFERNGRELKVRVDGQLIFNNIFQVRDAALDGIGLAYVPEDLARPYISKGQLVWMLQDWSPPWSGYHLYYPSRRQASPAFALIVEALRYRGK